MLPVLKGVTGILPVGYALVFALYLSLLLGEEGGARTSLAVWSARVLAFLHLGALLLRGFVLQHCPLATGFEIASFLALSILATHLVVERVTGYRSPGVPAVGLALALQTAASAYLPYEVVVYESMRFWAVPLHAVFGICGHAGFFVAGTYALLYLILYRLIKRHRLDRMWERLPPLETMHRMSFWAAGIGLGFFSLAIASGLGRAATQDLVPEPIYTSGVSWAAFAGLLVLGKVWRLSGRRFAQATLFIAVLDLASLFLTEYLHRNHLTG